MGTTSYEDFITRIFTGSYGMQMTYYLYIPAHLDPQKKYPLVLLLHGGGERAKVNNTPIQNRDVLLNQAYVKVWSSPKVQELWPSFIVVPLSREIWRMMKTFSSCQLREKHTLKGRQCWHEKLLISFQSASHRVQLD